MLSNIKVEKIDNTIVVSAMNYRRNMFVTVTDYDLNKKVGNIYTETVFKEVKSLKTWKTKVEEATHKEIDWNC